MVNLISHARLLEVLLYEPATGIFQWRVKLSKKTVVGMVAGSKRADGYVRIGIDGRDYLAHRLAVFYVTGAWPANEVDHQFGAPENNRYSDIREATHRENLANQKKPKNNTSGFKGASLHKKSGLFRARIKVRGREISLGYYNTVLDAHNAYVAAARKYNGKFARSA